MHPVVGRVFFLGLLVIGIMLATGRVEKHFISKYGGEGWILKLRASRVGATITKRG